MSEKTMEESAGREKTPVELVASLMRLWRLGHTGPPFGRVLAALEAAIANPPADAERLAEALEIPCKRRRAGGARPEVQIRDGEAGRMDRALALHAARLAADAAPGGVSNRPTIVCLCGSTRFMQAFFDAGWEETLAGKIVLSVGVCKHTDAEGGHGAEMLGPEVVAALDELHLRKIDLADEVLILNVGGYIGHSTRNELNYARSVGKSVRFLEPEEVGT